jgi:hypothetical protein
LFLSLHVNINLQTEVDTSFLTRLICKQVGVIFQNMLILQTGECNFSNQGKLTTRGMSICGVMVSVLSSGVVYRGF